MQTECSERRVAELVCAVLRIPLVFLLAALTFQAAQARNVSLQQLVPLADIGIPASAFTSSAPPRAHEAIARFSCRADLSSTGASFIGYEASVAARELVQSSELRFTAQAHARSKFLNIRVILPQGPAADYGVALTTDRPKTFQIRIDSLFAPSDFHALEQRPNDPVRIQFFVRNVFPGLNGFVLEQVELVDAPPPLRLHCPAETTVPIQKDTSLLVRVEDTDGLPFSGKLACYTSARNDVLLPAQVSAVSGFARVPIFVRTPGPHPVSFYEPQSGAFTSVTLHAVPHGLVVRLGVEEFEKQQSIVAPTFIAPRIQLEGGRHIPKSILVSAYDHRGQPVISQIVSAAALLAAQEKLLIPVPGLLEMRVRAYAEPLHESRRVPALFPLHVGSRPQDGATTAAIALPDGVTTRLVGGYIMALEEPPTSATLLGEDRFALWAFAKVPREVRLPLTLFGIDQADVSRMDIVDLGKLGRKLFGWQARIGPIWARFPYDLQEIVANPNAYSWPRVQTLAKEAKDRGLRCVVDVPVPDEAAVSDALQHIDRATTFTHWLKWLSQYRRAVGEKLRIFALRLPETQPDRPHSCYSPELVHLAFESAYRALDNTAESSPSLLAVFPPPFDPAEFKAHLPKAVRNWTEAQLVGLYTPLPQASPEENQVEAQIDLMRSLLRAHNLLRRPLWIGPVGWSSHPLWGSELTQANYLVRLYTIAASSKAVRVFWSDLHDRVENPWESPPTKFCGLLDSNLRPKPAAIACNLALFMLTSTKPLESHTTGTLTVHAFDIELHSMRWPGKLYVAWSNDEKSTATLRVPISPAGCYAFDYLGAQVDPVCVEPVARTDATDGETTKVMTFQVTHEPLYVWDVTTRPQRVATHKHQHDHEAQGPYTEREQGARP
ncbi:MAG: hypothetical protein ACP5QZ_00365 [Candidatus Sumerlaeaceae bacterium]